MCGRHLTATNKCAMPAPEPKNGVLAMTNVLWRSMRGLRSHILVVLLGVLLGASSVIAAATFVQWSREAPATVLLMGLGDVTLDGMVDIPDVELVAQALSKTSPELLWLDLNVDGVLNVLDLVIVGKNFGQSIEE